MSEDVLSFRRIQKKIGNHAFDGCVGIVEIVLPESMTELEWGAFSGCVSLTTVNLSRNIKRIGLRCFSGCMSLCSVVLPENIVEIDMDAFADCRLIKCLHIPSTVKIVKGRISCGYIDVSADNSHLCSENGVLYSKKKDIIYQYPAIDVSNTYKLNNNVRIIATNCFHDSVHLYTIHLSEHLEVIGESAFRGCVNLRSISIPASIKVMKTRIFWGCDNLESIYMYSETPNYIIIEEDVFLSSVTCHSIILYVPQGCKEKYKKHETFEHFKEIIEF